MISDYDVLSSEALLYSRSVLKQRNQQETHYSPMSVCPTISLKLLRFALQLTDQNKKPVHIVRESYR